MDINIKKRLLKVGYEYRTNEMKYIKDNLKCFIDNQGAYKRVCISGKWQIKFEHDAQVKYLVLEYIIAHFSLWELYIIFYNNQVDYSLDSINIHKARKISIKNINNEASLTMEETKRLKKKIWDLNPIIFGLTLEMIHLSKLFWDSEDAKIVFPEIDSQSNFSDYSFKYGNYNQDILYY